MPCSTALSAASEKMDCMAVFLVALGPGPLGGVYPGKE